MEVFFRRVANLGELNLALTEAVRETGQHPTAVPFNAVVRVDLTGGKVLLTILKRN